jgi:hypothetical protein
MFLSEKKSFKNFKVLHFVDTIDKSQLIAINQSFWDVSWTKKIFFLLEINFNLVINIESATSST